MQIRNREIELRYESVHLDLVDVNEGKIRIWFRSEQSEGEIRFLLLNHNDKDRRIGYYCPVLHEPYQEALGLLIDRVEEGWGQKWPVGNGEEEILETVKYFLQDIFFYDRVSLAPRDWRFDYIEIPSMPDVVVQA